jgi:hypothetical protein
MLKVIGLRNSMKPDFTKLKTSTNTAQPNFANLKPVTATAPLAVPDSSTKADQATFQANGNEGILSTAMNTIGNIPASGYNFVKGAISALNPLHTVETAQQIGTTIGQAQNEGQDVATLLKNTAKGLPAAAYHTLTPQFIQHIVNGNFDKASATLQNDPIGQIAPLILLARTAAQKAGVGAEFDSGITKIASPVTKPLSSVANTVGEKVAGATNFVVGQATGLQPDTITQIKNNPVEFSKQAQLDVTRPALAEKIGTAINERQTNLADTGKEYSGIRSYTEPIQVNPNYLENLIKEKTGLSVVDGKLKTSGSASVRLPGEVNSLQSKLLDVWQPEFAKGYLTADEFLNFRKDLGQMAYNDSGIGKNGTLANLSDIMRAKVNTDIRPQIPGLAELDSQFAPQITELKALSKGLVDKEGNLTDTAINRIANATGKGKDPFLARLEELQPGVTQQIKILKAVEDIQNAKGSKVGTYGRAGLATAGAVTLNPYMIVSAILSMPEIAIPLLRGVGYSSELTSSLLKTLNLPEKAANVSNKIAPATISVNAPSTK